MGRNRGGFTDLRVRRRPRLCSPAVARLCLQQLFSELERKAYEFEQAHAGARRLARERRLSPTDIGAALTGIVRGRDDCKEHGISIIGGDSAGSGVAYNRIFIEQLAILRNEAAVFALELGTQTAEDRNG